ncbi:hypothetical protein ACQPZJ_01605 [Actinoplanes sp. CA-054009]
MTIKLATKPCCDALIGDQCDCLTPEASAAEMAQLLRDTPPIVLPTGPTAQAVMSRRQAEDPFFIAMRAAACNVYDSTGRLR